MGLSVGVGDVGVGIGVGDVGAVGIGVGAVGAAGVTVACLVDGSKLTRMPAASTCASRDTDAGADASSRAGGAGAGGGAGPARTDIGTRARTAGPGALSNGTDASRDIIHRTGRRARLASHASRVTRDAYLGDKARRARRSGREEKRWHGKPLRFAAP